MTTYQLIVKNHIITMLLGQAPLISETVMFQACEKDMVLRIAVDYGYIPVFGIVFGDYQTVNFIQESPPC